VLRPDAAWDAVLVLPRRSSLNVGHAAALAL